VLHVGGDDEAHRLLLHFAQRRGEGETTGGYGRRQEIVEWLDEVRASGSLQIGRIQHYQIGHDRGGCVPRRA
jgi:hypothetical protein